MRRGAKPAKPKVEAKPPIARKSPKTEVSRVRDLEKRLAEALDQQAATSEILRVISRSQTDVQPVFDTIVRSAVVLCGAMYGSGIRFDGELMHLVAGYNYTPEVDRALHDAFPMVPSRRMMAGRAILARDVVQVEDALEDREYAEGIALAGGFRSMLAVPMLHDGHPIGAIVVNRGQPGPFSPTQIELLKTFADQAVIAIENVRLFKELGARNRDLTATSDILRVISSSPTDVQPVFDAIVRSAVTLCEGVFSSAFQFDGELVHVAALHNVAAQGLEEFHRLYPVRPSRDFPVGRAILERAVVHIPDVTLDSENKHLGLAQAIGWRSALVAPMLREGVPLGVITVGRATAGRFSESDIALLKTFADQAVIAIENVRLFTELQASNRKLTTALDTQTATSDILGVISRSQVDVQPVFEAIAENAARLVQAWSVTVLRWDGQFIHLAAERGGPPGSGQRLRDESPWLPNTTSGPGRCIATGTVIHVPDVDLESEDNAATRELAHGRGWRSNLCVPMLRDGSPIGAISVMRVETGPFSPGAIELLQTFADQAVIAIENVRLFTELEARNRDLTEALEQQTATAEILRAISGSPTDIQPVLDAVARSAARLCEAHDVLIGLRDGDKLVPAAHHGPIPAPFWPGPRPISRDWVTGRAVVDRQPVHIHDLTTAGEEFPLGQADALKIGFRTTLAVPLLREEGAIGVISIRRLEVRPFTDAQLALLRTFADQAVIAIENVRLFTELQASNRELTTALDTQTATSDILRVISRSQTDVQPVFDAILASAVRLLGAHSGTLTRIAGEQIELAAITSTTDVADAFLRARFPQALSSTGPHPRTIRDRAPLNIADAHTDPRLPETGHAYARVRGYRSQVVVPLLRHDEAIGTISLTRGEPGGFTIDEIGLLQSFADQAVIAIENVRLFKELEARNRDLSEALEQQTATSEVLKVISRSVFDLQPVLETLLENAARLCSAEWGVIFRPDGEGYRGAVAYGASPEFKEFIARTRIPPGRVSTVGRAALERRTVQIADVTADPEYQMTEFQSIGGFRTVLAVPMLREGILLGVFSLHRDEVRPFTDKQIELVTTFADQAVIAIENARLLSELQARTGELTRSVEELTALGDVSRALSSTLDLDAILQTIVTRASQLAGTDACSVFEYDEATEAFYLRATNNLDDEVVTLARQTPTHRGEGVQGRMAVTRQPVQVPDIAAEDAYHGPLRDILLRTGTRAVLAIPLLREDELIGGLTVNKKTPGEFSPEVIELLTTFATQSALAIQNARLFAEIADKSRQLEAASRHKSEFLANMSHELRTPLNAVIGFSEVLRQRMFGELNAKQDEYLKDIYTSGQHLLSLINDILDLSKIEAGRMELTAAPFHLPSAVENAVTLVRERAARHGIALHLDLDPELGELVGDERKIKQVLLNLLSNAVKFTPEGGRISLRTRRRQGAVEIAVTDTGIGIAPEDQAAIFEEFRQVGNDEARKQEGTGLGLTLAKKFIELHGGLIWVKSEMGRGSTFAFTLPVS